MSIEELPTSESCGCLGGVDEPWHNEIADLFGAGPEFIEWGRRLVFLAHQAGEDGELCRLAGSHQWSDQRAVYDLAETLQELAEALVRKDRS